MDVDCLAFGLQNVTSRDIHILWAGLTSDLRKIMKGSGCLEPAHMMSFSKDLNKGRYKEGGGEWSKHLDYKPGYVLCVPFASAFAYCEDAMLESLSAEYPSLMERCAPRMGGSPSFLFAVLRHLTSESDEVVSRLEGYFHREVVPQGTTLWRRNEPSNFACLLETGMVQHKRLIMMMM